MRHYLPDRPLRGVEPRSDLDDFRSVLHPRYRFRGFTSVLSVRDHTAKSRLARGEEEKPARLYGATDAVSIGMS